MIGIPCPATRPTRLLWSLLLVGLIALPAAAGPYLDCSLLDDPSVRGLMSGMLETKLLYACGRSHELGGRAERAAESAAALTAKAYVNPKPDTMVNDASGESGTSTMQSTTTIAVNLRAGIICSSFSDSYHWANGHHGFAGTADSADGGVTFTDHGALADDSFGQGSMVWRRKDAKFYLATSHLNGLGLYVADAKCASFTFHGMIHTGGSDDRHTMAVDNDPGSPFYGRLYVAFTDFAAGARIYVTLSADTTTWLTPVPVSAVGAAVQSGWPAVAPGGDLYVAWTRWRPYPTGPIDVEASRSTDGGVGFTPITNIWTGRVNPRQVKATTDCGRPALNPAIRIIPSVQLAVGPDGVVHAVWEYDPDGYATGDVIDVFYRRSVDHGVKWQTERRLNDDLTDTDQWNPSLSVGPDNTVVAAWYDRRLDPTQNHLFDYFKRISRDGGLSWEPCVRVSDASSAVYVNHDPVVATCYHGDFDHQVQDEQGRSYLQWSDDRQLFDGHPDNDVWFERDPNSSVVFVDSFESGSAEAWSHTSP